MQLTKNNNSSYDVFDWLENIESGNEMRVVEIDK